MPAPPEKPQEASGAILPGHRHGEEDLVRTKEELARLNDNLERLVTERTADLGRSVREFRATFERAAVGIVHVDPNGSFLRVNPRFCETSGYTEAELVGTHFAKLVHPDDLEAELEGLRRLLRGQQTSLAMEKRLKRKDGVVLWIHLTASAVQADDDTVAYLIGFIEDISESKRATEDLRLTNLKLVEQASFQNAIFSTAGSVLIATTPEGVITHFNPEAERMLGYTAQEMIGRVTPAVFHDPREIADRASILSRELGRDIPPGFEVFVAKARGGETEAREWTYVRKDGSRFAAILSIAALRDEERKVTGFLGIASDITKARQAEASLRQSEERFRLLVEYVKDYAILMLDPGGRVVTWNEGARRLKGYADEEIIGQSMDCFYTPEDQAAGKPKELLRKAAAEGRVEDEGWRVRKDGTRFEADVVLTPIRQKTGALMGFAKITRDVTHRKHLEQQLHQAQRVEAVGRLAGGVAHDFNNILGVITGYGELAQSQLPPDHPARPRIAQVLKAAQRGAGLTRQLLAFSRKQVMQAKLLDLNVLVADAEKMLGRLIGEDIDVVVRTAPGLGTVKADPGQIEQVILNLAVNARDAMPKGGKLGLETANVDLDEAYAADHPQVQPGRYVMLAISDTGAGMDQETQRRIFEPFFTTKPEGQGTGLGLSTVYGIVKQSDGHIWVYSEPGRGTTLKVYLPRLDQAPETTPSAGPPAEAPRGHETILLVEDTETLREVVRETLEERGYTVLLAANGEEGLALAKARHGPIDLLLTDVVMPKLGGGDLARLLSALLPELRVLYMSGYTHGAISQHGVPGEGVMLLEKPFTGDKLARTVRDTLDRPASSVTRSGRSPSEASNLEG